MYLGVNVEGLEAYPAYKLQTPRCQEKSAGADHSTDLAIRPRHARNPHTSPAPVLAADRIVPAANPVVTNPAANAVPIIAG